MLSHDGYYFRQAVKQNCSVNRPYAFPGSPKGADTLKVAFVPARSVIRGIFSEVRCKNTFVMSLMAGVCD